MKRVHMLIWGAVIAILFAAAGLYPVVKPPPAPAGHHALARPAEKDLSGYSDAAPGRPVDIVFIHHSVGGQLLADPGTQQMDETGKLYRTHPNGGGLRARLEAQQYRVHEASYSSQVGEHTDLFDWLPKFKTDMPRILLTAKQDQPMTEGRNEVVLFKSCFPNSFFREDHGGPGNPSGPELNVANAKATFMAVRDELAKHPDTLFVYFTAPPLRARETREPLYKYVAKKILGRQTNDIEQVTAADGAREFDNWIRSPQGWLKDYPLRNIVVFDYYDLLTGGDSNFLRDPSKGGTDDHPSSAAQRRAAEVFVPFLNRAVRYAGVVPP